MSAVAATIYEAGNGFPDVGDYVPGDDGSLYQVTELGPRIQTGSRSGEANHIPYCRVTLVDWSACEEGDEHTARAVLGSDEETEDDADEGDDVDPRDQLDGAPSQLTGSSTTELEVQS